MEKLKEEIEKNLPVSKSEPSESSESEAVSAGSLASCRIFYYSSRMTTRIYDMEHLTADEETMVLHLKVSQAMMSKLNDKIADNIANVFSKFQLGGVKVGRSPPRKLERSNSVMRSPKYEQFDDDKRNFTVLMDQYRDHCLKERDRMNRIIRTLYERVGGKDRVWRREKPEPVRVNSLRTITIGYSFQLVDWTPLDVEDFESSQILLSTISCMSGFSKTSSLVHNESITVADSSVKKRGRITLDKADTR